ncbi:fec operon regulator FecR [compost metagenome]
MNKKNTDTNNLGKLIWLSDLFNKYYEHKATDIEMEILEKWNPEKDGEPDLRFFKKDSITEKLWQDIASELGFASPERKILPYRKWIQKYAAAAVLLLFLASGLYFYSGHSDIGNTQQTVAITKDYFETQTGHKKMVLPDGTVVFMNSDTKLGITTASFNEEKREIWLEEGEAFFEVAKNPEKPFIVHSSDLETTVKGTSFNVQAYAELDKSSVSVRSGKVEVRNEDNLVGMLTKDNQIIYDRATGKSKQLKVDWHEAAAWMEYRLVMKRADIKELKLRLRQQFGVEVIAKDNVLQGTLLNSSFDKGVTLKQVLEVISVVYDVKYDMSKKGKVIIYK